VGDFHFNREEAGEMANEIGKTEVSKVWMIRALLVIKSVMNDNPYNEYHRCRHCGVERESPYIKVRNPHQGYCIYQVACDTWSAYEEAATSEAGSQET
jgi:hypothetical protein